MYFHRHLQSCKKLAIHVKSIIQNVQVILTVSISFLNMIYTLCMKSTKREYFPCLQDIFDSGIFSSRCWWQRTTFQVWEDVQDITTAVSVITTNTNFARSFLDTLDLYCCCLFLYWLQYSTEHEVLRGHFSPANSLTPV